MRRFVFEEATLADDASLRAMMRDVELTGHVSVSFRREPSYFAGCSVQGGNTRITICRDTRSGEVAGFGTRSTRNVYINGTIHKVGFLSDLRIREAYRNSLVLHKLYRELRNAHQQDPVPFYLTMILSGNDQARDALIGSRAGLPNYTSLGFVSTPLVIFGGRRKHVLPSGIRISKARVDEISEIYDFLNRTVLLKQFSSHYEEAEIQEGSGAPHVEDFYVARYGDELVGVVLAWDQSAIRQTHVERYSTLVGSIRPFYNVAARMVGSQKLPHPGEKLPYFYLSHIAVKENDPHIFDALFSHVYEDRRLSQWAYCVVGLHASDPLGAVLTKYRRIRSAGELFLVHYKDDALPDFDTRIPYVDIGTI